MYNHSTVVLNWIANGLKNNRNTLLAFLDHHNIDIACITETHLSYTEKIKFSGYKIYHADRVTQVRSMGGVALLVRNKIIQQQMSITGLECLEAIAVLININNRPIMFVSAYQSPSRRMHIPDNENVMSLHNSIVIAEDLNSKHTN
jgi:exonuclease III